MTIGTVLITGGAGYIGSHCVVELTKEGYECIVVDNFSNSNPESLERVGTIVGKKISWHEVDIRDKEGLTKIFKKNNIEAVIHLAGLKSVGESCSKPLLYYQNNVCGTITLLEVMQEYKVRKLVFSSSATVYGTPKYLPLDEKHPVGGCANPYGSTKHVIEMILEDVTKSTPELGIVSLRYFNPVGAHASGMIGEDPQGIPNNLMPYITQVAVGRRDCLQIFGTDYETEDGTGVRDYIHVVDLALGHVAAVSKLFTQEYKGFQPYNLGTGTGYSVRQVLQSMEKAVGREIPSKDCPRRDGDVAISYSDVTFVNKELGWKATRNLDNMCEDSWRFQQMNPMGYKASRN